MIIPKRRAGFRLTRTLLVFVFTLTTIIYILQGNTASLYISTRDFSAGTLLRFSSLPKANSTLGFGAIAAVSRTNSSRRDGLILAARITGLDITIPVQQVWTDEDISLVKAKEGSLLTRGSALAWLGHLNLLNWFLSTDLETVLILEDDVDWDIHLRTSQVPKVAATVRHLLNEQRGYPIRTSPNPESAGGYWGDPKQWDILYLGHCGDEIKPGKWNFRVQRASFYDSTLPPRQVLEKKTRKMLGSIALPDNVRAVHQSIEPLCTFGFAITRAAAKMLLYDIALREPDGGVQAYDVRVLEACRDLGFRCWTSTPELFHHMHHGSEIAGVDKQMKVKAEPSVSSGAPSATETGGASETKTNEDPTSTRGYDYGIARDGNHEDGDADNAVGQQAEDDTHGEASTADAHASQEHGAASEAHGDGWVELVAELPRNTSEHSTQNSTVEHSISDSAKALIEEDDDADYRDGHWQDDDEEDDDVDNLSPQDPRRTPDKAPNIACGARWFKAHDEAELAMLRELVGKQGRCISQHEESEASPE